MKDKDNDKTKDKGKGEWFNASTNTQLKLHIKRVVAPYKALKPNNERLSLICCLFSLIPYIGEEKEPL